MATGHGRSSLLFPYIQKEIIAKCNAAYKPVITATQMLDSMQQNRVWTRAEVADVANAIYDVNCDAVMPSGGVRCRYSVEAVKMQASMFLATAACTSRLTLRSRFRADERHPRRQRCGYVRCEHGHHRWSGVITVGADDHRSYLRSPDLALPS